MTVDDENSVYVGGLPYDSTEDSIQRAFEIYGTIIAVKIVNDREFGGKCYGFVTFTNPRAAVNAINDMDGKAIGGRTVRVNEVKSKSSRATFARENHFRDRIRDRDRDREREDRDEDREPQRERIRDRDEDREQQRERVRDRDEDREQRRERIRDRARDTDRDSDLDRDREPRFRNRIGTARRISSPRDQKPSPRNLNSTVRRSLRERGGRSPRGRSYSGSSSDKKRNASESPSPKRYERLKIDENSSKQKLTSTLKEKDLEKVKEELDEAVQRRDELKHEVAKMEEESYNKELFMSEMQKKSQKLEESIAIARRTASQRRKQLKKLQNCFIQFKDYSEKLKSCEQEIQLLVDASVHELNGLDDGGDEDGHTANANGNA